MAGRSVSQGWWRAGRLKPLGLTVGTGKNQCVMDTLEAARKSAMPPHS